MDTVERTVTIPNGGSLSDVVDLGEYRLVGFRPPTAWTTASLTFSVAVTPDGTFTSLRNNDSTSTEFAIVTGAITGAIVSSVGQTVMLTVANAELFRNVPYLRLRSGTVASPTNQGAARTFTLILKRVWR